MVACEVQVGIKFRIKGSMQMSELKICSLPVDAVYQGMHDDLGIFGQKIFPRNRPRWPRLQRFEILVYEAGVEKDQASAHSNDGIITILRHISSSRPHKHKVLDKAELAHILQFSLSFFRLSPWRYCISCQRLAALWTVTGNPHINCFVPLRQHLQNEPREIYKLVQTSKQLVVC